MDLLDNGSLKVILAQMEFKDLHCLPLSLHIFLPFTQLNFSLALTITGILYVHTYICLFSAFSH